MSRSLPCIPMAAAAALAALSGCRAPAPVALGAPQPQSRGQTAYLGGLVKPERPPLFTGGKPKDNVSYWDDSVSGSPSITIDLSDQKAYFRKGGKLAGIARIATGKKGYETPTGSFKITQKNKDHESNLYGSIYNAAGEMVKYDADTRKDKVPPGGRYDGADMPNFLRFNGGVGMHAGNIPRPGAPASHGCVRMPRWISAKFYANSRIGTPVYVRQ